MENKSLNIILLLTAYLINSSPIIIHSMSTTKLVHKKTQDFPLLLPKLTRKEFVFKKMKMINVVYKKIFGISGSRSKDHQPYNYRMTQILENNNYMLKSILSLKPIQDGKTQVDWIKKTKKPSIERQEAINRRNAFILYLMHNCNNLDKKDSEKLIEIKTPDHPQFSMEISQKLFHNLNDVLEENFLDIPFPPRTKTVHQYAMIAMGQDQVNIYDTVKNYYNYNLYGGLETEVIFAEHFISSLGILILWQKGNNFVNYFDQNNVDKNKVSFSLYDFIPSGIGSTINFKLWFSENYSFNLGLMKRLFFIPQNKYIYENIGEIDRNNTKSPTINENLSWSILFGLGCRRTVHSKLTWQLLFSYDIYLSVMELIHWFFCFTWGYPVYGFTTKNIPYNVHTNTFTVHLNLVAA